MIRLALLLLMAPVGPALADVLVRTAEHGTFTRVVVDYSAPEDWRLERNASGVGLLTSGPITYDLSDVYRRIGTDRIRSISQKNGVLDIGFECECEAITDQLPSGGLVIDIRQSEKPETQQTRSGASAKRVDYQSDERSPDILLLPGLLTRRATVFDRSGSEDPDEAAALRRQLLTEISNFTGEDAATPQSKLPPLDDSFDPQGAGAEVGHVKIGSRRGEDLQGGKSIPNPARCAPVLLEPVSAWLSDDPSDPKDHTETNIASYARFLILRGFGAEAGALLSLDRNAESTGILSEIAALVDGPTEAPLVTAMADCSGLAAIFAVLADPPVRPSRHGSVLATLQEISEPNRTSLARRMEQRLRAIGANDFADVISRANGGVSEANGPGADRDDGPDRNLEFAVANRTPEAADALRTLILNRISDNSIVDAGLLGQADILLRQTEGAPRDHLEEAIIRAYIHSENFIEAAKAVDRLKKRIGTPVDHLDDMLMRGVSGSSEDAAFLRDLSLLAERPVQDPELRIDLASRALGLGLPDLADRVLAARSGLPHRTERVVSAQVAMERKDWKTASERLIGLTGDDVDALRKTIDARRKLDPVAVPVTAPDAGTGILSRNARVAAETADLLAEWGAFLERREAR